MAFDRLDCSCLEDVIAGHSRDLLKGGIGTGCIVTVEVLAEDTVVVPCQMGLQSPDSTEAGTTAVCVLAYQRSNSCLRPGVARTLSARIRHPDDQPVGELDERNRIVTTAI